MSNSTPSDLISPDFTQLSRVAQDLAFAFAVFPEDEGVPKKRLLYVLPDETNWEGVLQELEREKWITYNEQEEVFKITPELQEVIRLHFPENPPQGWRSIQDTLTKRIESLKQWKNRPEDISLPDLEWFATVGKSWVDTYMYDSQDIRVLLGVILPLLYEILGFYGDTYWEYAERYHSLTKEKYLSQPDQVDIHYEYAKACHKLVLADAMIAKKTQNFSIEFNNTTKELCASYPNQIEFKVLLVESHRLLVRVGVEDTQQYIDILESCCEAYPDHMGFKESLLEVHKPRGEKEFVQESKLADAYYQMTKDISLAHPEHIKFKFLLAEACYASAIFYRDYISEVNLQDAGKKAIPLFQESIAHWEALVVLDPAKKTDYQSEIDACNSSIALTREVTGVENNLL